MNRRESFDATREDARQAVRQGSMFVAALAGACVWAVCLGFCGYLIGGVPAFLVGFIGPFVYAFKGDSRPWLSVVFYMTIAGLMYGFALSLFFGNFGVCFLVSAIASALHAWGAAEPEVHTPFPDVGTGREQPQVDYGGGLFGDEDVVFHPLGERDGDA